MTLFKANFRSYILLGLFLMIFVGIPASILITLIAAPASLLAVFAGNIMIAIVVLGLIMVAALAVVGWLTFRFVKGNKWG